MIAHFFPVQEFPPGKLGTFQKILWDLFEHPHTSLSARVIGKKNSNHDTHKNCSSTDIRILAGKATEKIFRCIYIYLPFLQSKTLHFKNTNNLSFTLHTHISHMYLDSIYKYTTNNVHLGIISVTCIAISTIILTLETMPYFQEDLSFLLRSCVKKKRTKNILLSVLPIG